LSICMHARSQSLSPLAHVCCGQTAGWIKVPLGMEVDLDPSDIVLYGDPAPLPKEARSQFLARVYCDQVAHLIYC